MTESSFKPGTSVKCPAFKGVGEIVSGPNRKGEYSVRLGHLSLWVAGASLTAAEPERAKQKSAKSLANHEERAAVEALRIDLHGHKVADALEVLERTIDRAILQNAAKVEIIHGFGTGAVKHAVDEYLASCKHVLRFHVDEKNRGTTWAYLD